MSQPQQTYASKSKRYILQRDEWIRSLQVHITPQIERMLREFYKAAVIAHEKRPDLTLEHCFTSLVEMSRGWSDDAMRANIGEAKARDAEICLQQAVKCHATVLSLSTATPCRQKLEVPNVVKFFRSVIDAAVSDLAEVRMSKEGGVSVFGTSDMAQRKRARGWIDRIVLNKCLEVVPIGMFARQPVPSPVVSEDEGSDAEEEEAPKPKKKKPVVVAAEEKKEVPAPAVLAAAMVAAAPEPPMIKIDSTVAAEGAKSIEKITADVAAPAAAEPAKESESIAVAISPKAAVVVAAAEAESAEPKRLSEDEEEDDEDDDDDEEDDDEEDEDESESEDDEEPAKEHRHKKAEKK